MLTPGFRQHWMASNFIQRIVQNGGTLQQNEILALNYWCWENDKNGLLSNYIAYYPFVGGGTGSTQSITNFSQNLISSSYTLTPSAVTSSMCTSQGYQGNGTSSFWNTGYLPTSIIVNNSSLSCYVGKVNYSSGTGFEFRTDSSNNFQFQLATNFGGFLYFWSNATKLNGPFASNFIGGYFTGNLLTSNNSMFVNGISQSITPTVYGFLSHTNPLYLGAANESGVASFFSNKQIKSGSIGQGFTPAQEAIRFQIEQNTQKILNRQINF